MSPYESFAVGRANALYRWSHPDNVEWRSDLCPDWQCEHLEIAVDDARRRIRSRRRDWPTVNRIAFALTAAGAYAAELGWPTIERAALEAAVEVLRGGR